MSARRGGIVVACATVVLCASTVGQMLLLHARKIPFTPWPTARSAPRTPAAPSECTVLGHTCDCPPSSRPAPRPLSREAACSILQGKTVLFAGDSLSRDMWSSAAIWLLTDEILRMGHASSLNHNQACMACAWKFAPEIWADLRSSQSLTEVLTPEKSVSTVHACGGRARLIFKYARLFSDAPSIVQELAAAPGAPADKALVVTAGILEMSVVRSAVASITEWVAQLEARTPRDTTAIFMGTHARIPGLAPIAFQADAYAWQGNAQIRLWTAVVKAASQRLRVVDPFALTEELDETYRDTEDGLHFGQWINLQKFQSVLREINATAY